MDTLGNKRFFIALHKYRGYRYKRYKLTLG